MQPASFVSEHKPVFDQRSRSPNCSPRLVAPNKLALICCETVQVAIAGANVYSPVCNNRTFPDTVFNSLSAIFPHELAIRLSEAINKTIFGGGVNETVYDGGS